MRREVGWDGMGWDECRAGERSMRREVNEERGR